jgi:hypothetical protein
VTTTTTIGTSGFIVPVLALGNRGYLMERTPVVSAARAGLGRFVLLERHGWHAPWRPAGSRLTRAAAHESARRRNDATGVWMAVVDTRPEGLFPVREEWRCGGAHVVVEDADGKAVPQ